MSSILYKIQKRKQAQNMDKNKNEIVYKIFSNNFLKISGPYKFIHNLRHTLNDKVKGSNDNQQIGRKQCIKNAQCINPIIYKRQIHCNKKPESKHCRMI